MGLEKYDKMTGTTYAKDIWKIMRKKPEDTYHITHSELKKIATATTNRARAFIKLEKLGLIKHTGHGKYNVKLYQITKQAIKGTLKVQEPERIKRHSITPGGMKPTTFEELSYKQKKAIWDREIKQKYGNIEHERIMNLLKQNKTKVETEGINKQSLTHTTSQHYAAISPSNVTYLLKKLIDQGKLVQIGDRFTFPESQLAKQTTIIKEKVKPIPKRQKRKEGLTEHEKLELEMIEKLKQYAIGKTFKAYEFGKEHYPDKNRTDISRRLNKIAEYLGSPLKTTLLPDSKRPHYEIIEEQRITNPKELTRQILTRLARTNILIETSLINHLLENNGLKKRLDRHKASKEIKKELKLLTTSKYISQKTTQYRKKAYLITPIGKGKIGR